MQIFNVLFAIILYNLLKKTVQLPVFSDALNPIWLNCRVQPICTFPNTKGYRLFSDSFVADWYQIDATGHVRT